MDFEMILLNNRRWANPAATPTSTTQPAVCRATRPAARAAGHRHHPGTVLPFFGADLWTAFEVSWLNLRGKPQVALVQVTIPVRVARTRLRARSFKLYLNSFNNTPFADTERGASPPACRSAAVWHGAPTPRHIGGKSDWPER